MDSLAVVTAVLGGILIEFVSSRGFWWRPGSAG